MDKNIKLSVVIISYNQEKYISESIESVLNQKTSFKYELILADDCSSDNTFKIMEKYSKKYPDIIRLLKRKKNLGATQNILDACKNSLGEYITILEGDDYWIDNNKIQSQIDFLDNHQDYIGITHLQQGKNLENKVIGNFPIEIKEDCDITIEDYINGKLKYSATSTLYKNIYRDKNHVNSMKYLFSLNRIVGDAQICIYLLSLGKIKIIAKPMMVYRIRNSKNDSNYNSTHSIAQIEMDYLNIYLEMDNFFDGKYNFYKKYENIVTLGFIYSIFKLKLKDALLFIKKCPKKYRLKIVLLMPINCIRILLKKINK